MINKDILSRLDDCRRQFNNATPFRHLALDNFFDAEVAEQLLDQFPAFEDRYAINEFGEVGRKAVVTDIDAISDTYRRAYAYLNSAEFLQQVSRLTGIPDLLPDPDMYGGGTHENLEGQNLHPHVDFNYSEDRTLHRRLNILLYLNREWEEEWGGCIELHSNPRDPENDQVSSYLPLFNRAVIFETNEYSWHGFRTIRLPDDKKHLSRKCLSIYLYTRERPAGEIVPEHGTFYVQEPLPGHFQPGHTLSAEDVGQLKGLLQERDDFIAFYQKMELEKNAIIDSVTRNRDAIARGLRLPITGYVRQSGAAEAYWHDHWISVGFQSSLEARTPVTGLVLHGHVPDKAGAGYHVNIHLGNQAYERHLVPGDFALALTPDTPLEGAFTFAIDVPHGEIMEANLEPGGRALAFLIFELAFQHKGARPAQGRPSLKQRLKRLFG